MPLAARGGWGGESDKVPTFCAEPTAVCIAVSLFFEIPIQNNFSENQKLRRNPPSQVLDLGGVGGYVKGAEVERPSPPHSVLAGVRPPKRKPFSGCNMLKPLKATVGLEAKQSLRRLVTGA